MHIHIVAIYCVCDDMMYALHHRNDPQYHLSDAEIMTIALVAALYSGGNYAPVHAHLAQYG